MGAPVQKVEHAPENPSVAKTEKSPQSEPILEQPKKSAEGATILRKNLLSERNCGKSKRAVRRRKRRLPLPWTKALLPTKQRNRQQEKQSINSRQGGKRNPNPKKRGK